MYENCWENLSLQTERQFVTFVSSLKRGGEKLQHCLIGRFTGDKWFAGGKKWIVQSGLNQSGLVRSLLSLLNHPDWSGGLTSEHCFPQGGERMCRNWFPDLFLARDERINQQKAEQSLISCQMIASGNYSEIKDPPGWFLARLARGVEVVLTWWTVGPHTFFLSIRGAYRFS